MWSLSNHILASTPLCCPSSKFPKAYCTLTITEPDCQMIRYTLYCSRDTFIRYYKVCLYSGKDNLFFPQIKHLSCSQLITGPQHRQSTVCLQLNIRRALPPPAPCRIPEKAEAEIHSRVSRLRGWWRFPLAR